MLNCKLFLGRDTFFTHKAFASAKPKEQNFSHALVRVMKINCNFDKIVKVKISR